MTAGPFEILLRRQLLAWLGDNRPDDALKSTKQGRVALGTARNGREENEDRAFYAEFLSPRADRSFALLAVLDGIGGLVDGGECAELAITAILSKLLVRRKVSQRITLIEALGAANDEVRDAYRGRGGVTFAGIFIQHKRVIALNVGDTRVYHFDESRGGLKRLSTDDRLGAQLAKVKGLENIDLDPELATRLGQFLGMHDAVRPNVRMINSSPTRSSVGYFVVATDGGYSVGEDFIVDALLSHSEPRDFIHAVVKQTRCDASADNATLACARADHLVPPERSKLPGAAFEQLQLWTTEGNFTFVIPDRLPRQMQRSSPSQESRHEIKEHRSPDPRLAPEGQRRKPEEKSRVESPKRELLIQQLRFEGEHEPTE
jgi:serine/threonine protein phosphatase PrpC